MPEALAIHDGGTQGRTEWAGAAHEARVAVFIDVPSLWGNARMDGVHFHPGALLDALARLGSVVSARAYTPAAAGGVLRPGVLDLVLVALRGDSHFVVTASADGGVDGALAADLLAAATGDLADVFVLVTADPDFVPTLRALRQLGKHVVVVSFAGMGGDLADLADEVVLLNPSC